MLNKEQEIKLNELMKVSDAIKVLYDKLCYLETNNLKETIEYKKYVDYLEISREVEEDTYKKINNKDLEKIYDYISNDKKYQRIYYKLTQLEIGQKTIPPLISYYADCFDVQINTIFFSLLDEKIKENDPQKEILCKIKYENLYINPYLEEYAVINNFKMNNNYVPIFEIDNFILPINEIKKYTLITEFYNKTSKILIKDSKKLKTEDIADLYFLEAILILLDSESVLNLYNKFTKLKQYEINKELYYYIAIMFENNKENKIKHKVHIIKK